jgi:hypothetical protein
MYICPSNPKKPLRAVETDPFSKPTLATIPSPKNFLQMQRKEHRGRIQAQGGGLEASENWAQDEPLTADEGRSLLQRLKAKLSRKERKQRKHHLKKLEDLIDRAEDTGGLHAHFSKSFQDDESDVRVDIEVLGGTAFICAVLAIILWAVIQ